MLYKYSGLFLCPTNELLKLLLFSYFMVIKEYLLWEENLGTLKKHKEENKNHYIVANI